MKNLLTVIALIISLTSFGQVGRPHHGISQPTNFAIEEIEPKVIAVTYDAFGMPAKTDTAFNIAMSAQDNLRDDSLGAATFTYIFLNRELQPLKQGDKQRGSCVMNGRDYERWDGTNSAAFYYVAGKIGVILK